MVGGYSITTMTDYISQIKASPIDKFRDGRAALTKLIRDAKSSDFIDSLNMVTLGDKNEIIKELMDSYALIDNLSDNMRGYGQKLVEYPETFDRLKAAVTRFQDVLDAIKDTNQALQL